MEIFQLKRSKFEMKRRSIKIKPVLQRALTLNRMREYYDTASCIERERI